MALALTRTTGELIEIERLTVSSERGGWKSARRGNSLAAYSTARPVWSGGKTVRSYLPLRGWKRPQPVARYCRRITGSRTPA